MYKNDNYEPQKSPYISFGTNASLYAHTLLLFVPNSILMNTQK